MVQRQNESEKCSLLLALGLNFQTKINTGLLQLPGIGSSNNNTTYTRKESPIHISTITVEINDLIALWFNFRMKISIGLPQLPGISSSNNNTTYTREKLAAQISNITTEIKDLKWN